MHLQFLSKQVKPEAFKSWLLLNESLQSSVTLFYAYIGYYLINQNTNNNTWNIRKQALEYIIFLKRKRRVKVKVKAKGCAKNCHCVEYNLEAEYSSHIVPLHAHIISCVTNAMDFNYKLRSVIR